MSNPPKDTFKFSRRRGGRTSLGLLFGALAWACQERSSATDHRFDAVSRTETPQSKSSLYSTGVLQRALGQIRARVGESAPVLVLEVGSERATIQVESPARSGRVVQYEWFQDTLRGPIPVELRGSGTLEANLFPLSSVELEKLPELVREALNRIDREHGKVKRMVVRRSLPADEAVGIRVYVESPIRSSHVDADAHGRILEVSKTP